MRIVGWGLAAIAVTISAVLVGAGHVATGATGIAIVLAGFALGQARAKRLQSAPDNLGGASTGDARRVRIACAVSAALGALAVGATVQAAARGSWAAVILFAAVGTPCLWLALRTAQVGLSLRSLEAEGSHGCLLGACSARRPTVRGVFQRALVLAVFDESLLVYDAGLRRPRELDCSRYSEGVALELTHVQQLVVSATISGGDREIEVTAVESNCWAALAEEVERRSLGAR